MINITIDKPQINKKQFLDKLVNIILNVLIVVFSVVLLISLYTTVQIKILGHKYANFFGYSMFEISSGSMEPVLKKGDWIIIKLSSDVKAGDIITYEDKKGAFVTHRIMEVYKGTYVTKGDNNIPKDDPIDESQVIGKLSRILGNFGILRKTILNAPVLITLIIALLLLNSIFKKDDKALNLLKKVRDFILNKINKVSKKEKVKEEKIATPIENDENVLDDSILEQIKNINVDDINMEDTVSIPMNAITDEPIPVREEIKEEEPAIKEEETPVIEEVFKEEESSEVEEGPIVKEEVQDNLEKTSLHRVISVDLSELNETKLEIAINEMADKESPEEIEVPTPKGEEETSEENEEEKLTDIELKNQKENKNVIISLMNIKKEELSELIWAFSEDEVLELNETTIRSVLINAYINGRYYDYYADKEELCKGRSITTRVQKLIELSGEDLITNYSGKDKKYEDKVLTFVNLLKLIANLDQAKSTVSEASARKEYYKNEIQATFSNFTKEKVDGIINELMRIQKSYISITKYYLKKLETEVFYLDFDKIPSRKNMWVTDLRHNVEFNRLYSNYVINKTYKEGIIAEDKMQVLFTLLAKQLVADMLDATFNKKYVIYIPRSLYKKERKLLGLLKLLEDEYAKSHMMIAIMLEDLKENKTLVGRVRKCGFKFALAMEDNINLSENEWGILYLVNQVFISKEYFESIIHNIPEDLREIIIYDDIIRYIDDMEEDEE